MSGKPKDGLYLDHQALKVLTDRIAALEAELADSVPRGWDGLLTILDDVYPAVAFGGVEAEWQDESRDIGPRLVTLARHLDAERKRAKAAESETKRLNAAWKELRRHYDLYQRENGKAFGKMMDAVLAAREEAGDE